jgi:glycosyltransferase involved in cell wall biosynthesis
MRIGIDVRCLAEGRRTGVEEYTLNLLENLFAMDTRNTYILFFNSFRSKSVDFSWLEKYPNVSLKSFNFPNKILNFLFWYFNWPKIDKLLGGTDIFFMPNIIFGSVSRDTKLIVTVHDLSFVRYPETFSWKRRWWHLFINPQKICKRADKIIAVSDSSARDIEKLFRIKSEKIQTITSGISEKFQVVDRNDANLIRVKEKYNLPYKFILFLGTIEPRKNIRAIIAAYNQLQTDAENNKQVQIEKYKLVIAGSEGWLSEKIFAEIQASKYRDNIIVAKFIAEDDKEFVLNLASLFVYPSLFEGFGFPPLEAMACGVPVITSNNSSMPEIVGSGSIMVDPHKPDEIAHAMQEILTNEKLRGQLITRGFAQSQKFNWTKTAEEFLKMLYKM